MDIDDEPFLTMTLLQLKAECRKRKLPVSGRKDELLLRLQPPTKRRKFNDPDQDADYFNEKNSLWISINNIDCRIKKWTLKHTRKQLTEQELMREIKYILTMVCTVKNNKFNDLEMIPISETKIYYRDNNGILKYSIDFFRPISDVCIPRWNKLWRLDYNKIKASGRGSQISIQVNITYLEYCVETGLKIPGRILLMHCINKRFKPFIKLDDFAMSNILYKSQTPDKQPDNLKIKMYQYQLDCLHWMKNIEENIKNISFSPFIPISDYITCDSNLSVDTSTNRFAFTSSPIIQNVSVKGGILADEMGLGKTIEILSLILARPLESSTPYIQSYCKDFPKFQSKATLVLCPNHLVKQWVDEIQDKSNLIVYGIISIIGLWKLTYENLINADVVIVAFNFIESNSYQQLCCFSSPSTFSWHRIIFDSATLGNELLRRKNPLKTSSPILHLIHWHRIVLDEGHEFLPKKQRTCNLNDFSSTYRWYVSGSPFPSDDMIFKVLLFLGLEDESNYRDTKIRENKLAVMLKEKLYWRNTKILVSDQLNIPDYVQEVILMEPTEIEKALFISVDRLHLRKLCCHPQISFQDRLILGDKKKTLSEIRKNMLNHIETRIKELTQEIDEYQIVYERLLKELTKIEDIIISTAFDRLNKKERKKEKQKEIDQIQRDLQNSRQSLLSQRQRYRFLDTAIPLTIQNIKDPCNICYEFKPESMAILSCGHMLCYTCTAEIMTHSRACPMCRKPIIKKDIIRIASEKQKEKISLQQELCALIEKNGTKMGNLIYYIRKQIEKENSDLPCRFIVFSQWDEMLQLIGKTLNENGIKNVFVKGLTRDKNDAINTFQNDVNVRVIMLSLQNAASGTNLTQATHIIFTDPVEGSKAKRSALDQQAIARAHRIGQKSQITVVRMILKGTIEEDIFNSYDETEK